MIFQANAWSDIFLSESYIANFVYSDIIFASKLGVAEYHTAKPYITA
ncbi:MAG: hypothetical protein IJY79_09230 [Clostridia bacterium]|nr:hypothetical protein [Clostridia bacterium]